MIRVPSAVARGFSSLRVRLLSLVLLAMLPALGVIASVAIEQRRDAIAEGEATALRVARLASIDQGRRLESAGELLVALADLPEVRGQDPAACGAVLGRVRAQHPLYLNLGAARTDGSVFCSAVPIAGPINVADRAYFVRATSGRRFAVGDYQIGRLTRKASLNVAYPILADDGALRGVVYAAIDLAALNQLVREAELPERSTLTVIDGNGTILVRHPDAEQWVGTSYEAHAAALMRERRTGVAEASDSTGTPRLLGFVPLLSGSGAGDVYVAIGIPRNVALAGANRRLRRSLVTLGLVSVAALVAAWYGGDALVLRRVTRVVGATRRLAAGDLAARAGGPYDGELGQLARAFDEMAESIRDRQAELERSHQAVAGNEKLAALGRLAAGVAHELRNPLTVIDARLQLLARRLDGGPPSREALSSFVTALAEASERMNHIMLGLSNYARPSKSELTVVDVREVLINVPPLLAYQARTGDVTVVLDVPDAMLPVWGEPSEIMQILVNLATNAVEAMAGRGGLLTLTAGLDAADPRRVSVAVADTGPGMAGPTLERVWAPFYTTKPDGTGLGLSIVRGLTDKQPGATITFDSREGVGTVFTLTFPLAGAATGASAPRGPA